MNFESNKNAHYPNEPHPDQKCMYHTNTQRQTHMGCGTSLPGTMEDEIRDATHGTTDWHCSGLLEPVDDANGGYVVATLLPDSSGGYQDGSCALKSDPWCGRTEMLAVATAKGQCQ